MSYVLFRQQYVTCYDHVKALNDIHLAPIFKKHMSELRRTWTVAELRVALKRYQGEANSGNRVKLIEAVIASSGTVPEGSAADFAGRLLAKTSKRLQGD